MKNIKFKRITLVNFKAFRTFSLDFGEDVTNIHGANESGKTTIVDAVMWCLFNKDHLYRTSFAIKTHDENGNVLPNLEHSVELAISVDGVERTLKRVLKEKWTKPRGQTETVFSGNYQECYVDGALTSSTDYSVFIGSFIEETVFKCITSPTYFLSLPWQEKRNFLQKLAGDISNEEITAGEDKFTELLSELTKQPLEDYLKHIKYTAKEIKKKLDMIPVRISEQQKALPEKQDWDTVEDKIKELQAYIDKVTEQQKLTPTQRKRIAVDEKITEQQNLQNSRKAVIDQLYKKKVEEARKAYVKAQDEIKEIRKNERSCQDIAIRNESNIRECKAVLIRCEKDTQTVREQWSEVQNRVFVAPDIQVCPTCGQPLPSQQIEEIIQRAKDDFNAAKANDLAALRARAAEIKETKIQSEAQITACEKKKKDSDKILESFKSKIEELEKVKSYPDEVYLDLLQADEQYTATEKTIEKLRAEYMDITDIYDQELVDLTSDKAEVKRLTALLAEKLQYEKGCSLIEQIRKENTSLAQQLADLERKGDIATEYSMRADNLLESRINKYFSLVSWKMFRSLGNGNREPYCECIYKGTEANDGLNSAGYIMAGIDICNAIGKYYNVSAPVIIDNAESINAENFIPSEGQQIRLFVSGDKQLTIR